MPTVNAERLNAETKKRGFTQERLAEAVGISREQCGKQLRKRGAIRINESTARGYEKAFGLSCEELSKPPHVTKDLPSGWNRIMTPMSDEDLLILRLTAMRYGTDPISILRMSSALFIIVAELHLADRTTRLTAAEAQFASVPDGFDHMADAVLGTGRIQDALWAERNAIAVRDLTGRTLSDDEWYDSHTRNSDLFQTFLAQKLKDLTPDVYDYQIGNVASDLFQEMIEELTQGDDLARMTLLKNDVHPRDVTAVPPEERAAFLRDRCSDSTRAAHEEREAFIANIEFDDTANSGRSDA